MKAQSINLGDRRNILRKGNEGVLMGFLKMIPWILFHAETSRGDGTALFQRQDSDTLFKRAG